MSSIKKTKSKATFPYYWTNLIMYVTVALISTKYIISINDMNIIVLNMLCFDALLDLCFCAEGVLFIAVWNCSCIIGGSYLIILYSPINPWFPIITGCPCITLEPAVSWPHCHSVYWIKRRNVNRKIAPWDWLPSYHSFELR